MSARGGIVVVGSALSIGVLVACAAGAPTTTSVPVVGSAASSAASASSSSVVAATSASEAPPSSSVVASASIAPVASSAAPSSSVPKISIGAGTKVFLFGDSMVVAGLGQRMEKLSKARGADYAENHWSSSNTKKWAESERLGNLLFKHKPDVVFITIGANEVYFKDKKAPEFIRTIVKKLAGRPCVWIGPPVWKTQKGIVEDERDNSSPCLFFDSQHLELERQPDGIHPTMDGGAAWADAVWAATIAP